MNLTTPGAELFNTSPLETIQIQHYKYPTKILLTLSKRLALSKEKPAAGLTNKVNPINRA